MLSIHSCSLLKVAAGKSTREILLSAVEAAERGAEATAQMKRRLGRSSYLGDRVFGIRIQERKQLPSGFARLSQRFFRSNCRGRGHCHTKKAGYYESSRYTWLAGPAPR